MLQIIIPSTTFWDEMNEEFIKKPEETLLVEHSLVSLSKWEQIWEKPFLGDTPKTTEETIDYIKCMSISPVNDISVYERLSQKNFDDVAAYINAKMTATWFYEPPGPKMPVKKQIITSEVIYYWMIAHNIPFECQYWHLNRLFTLIKVNNEKNAPPKKGPKMGRREMAAQRRALNDQRLREFNTTG